MTPHQILAATAVSGALEQFDFFVERRAGVKQIIGASTLLAIIEHRQMAMLETVINRGLCPEVKNMRASKLPQRIGEALDRGRPLVRDAKSEEFDRYVARATLYFSYQRGEIEVVNAAERGDMFVIENWKEPISHDYHEMVYHNAARFGHKEYLLKAMEVFECENVWDFRGVSSALLRSGRTDWFANIAFPDLSGALQAEEALLCIAHSHDVATLRFYLTHVGIRPPIADCHSDLLMELACTHTTTPVRLPLVRALHEELDLPFPPQAMLLACGGYSASDSMVEHLAKPSLEVMQYLSDNGVKVDPRLLNQVVRQLDVPAFDWLVARGCKPNSDTLVRAVIYAFDKTHHHYSPIETNAPINVGLIRRILEFPDVKLTPAVFIEVFQDFECIRLLQILSEREDLPTVLSPNLYNDLSMSFDKNEKLEDQNRIQRIILACIKWLLARNIAFPQSAFDTMIRRRVFSAKLLKTIAELDGTNLSRSIQLAEKVGRVGAAAAFEAVRLQRPKQ